MQASVMQRLTVIVALLPSLDARMVFAPPDPSDFKRIGNASQPLSILLTNKSQNGHDRRSLAETYYFRCDDMDCSGEVDCEVTAATFQVYASLHALYVDPAIEITWQSSAVPSGQYYTLTKRLTFTRVNEVEECKDIIVYDTKRYVEDMNPGVICSANTKVSTQVCLEFKVKSEGFFNRETSYDFRAYVQQVNEAFCEENGQTYSEPRTVYTVAFYGRESDKETCPQAGAIVMLVAIILVVFIGIGVGVFCSCRKKKQDVKPAA